VRQKQFILSLALISIFTRASLAKAADSMPKSIDFAQVEPQKTPQSPISQPEATQPPVTQQPEATQPPLTQQPAAIDRTAAPPRQIERIEPAATPVSSSLKSQAQLEYEANMQIRFDGFAKTIKNLETQLETLSKKDQRVAVKYLRTAQGNRSVARTKLKQLRFIAPNQWTSVQAGIERAMVELEQAVGRADAAMNPKE
jgi:hypothetical protein